MPTRQPSLGANQCEDRCEKNTATLYKTSQNPPLYHPLLRFAATSFQSYQCLIGELFECACPMHCWTSNRSSSNRLPLQHSASPSFMGETHDVAGKFPMLISAVFSPCFDVSCVNPSNTSCLELQPRMGSYVESGYQVGPYPHYGRTGAQLQNLRVVSRWHRRIPACI